MIFRQAKETDISNIMNIIMQAQDYLKEQGIDQWQNNYPNIETIKNDIAHKYSYILEQDNRIVATVAVSFDGETTYDTIWDGEWISNDKYAVIHRIAVDDNYKGLGIATQIMNKVEELCLDNKVHSIRIDTHKQNLTMQKLLLKNDFKYCGIIYLQDSNKRIAFEKMVDVIN